MTVANNGREAVEALLGGAYPPPYDVVLMDLQMPEMDGYQATARIRADSRFASLPIIAMTAHATLEERAACIAAGMNDHISKPIYPNVLFDTVARYFRPATGGCAGEHVRTPHRPRPRPRMPLPVVDGLDTADGLLRVGGNRKLYLKLLRQFVDDERDAAVRIRERLAAGDHATAERMAHTVKGVAGNLGARERSGRRRRPRARGQRTDAPDRGALRSAGRRAVGALPQPWAPAQRGQPPAPSPERPAALTRCRFAGLSPGCCGA